jgi:hypothetical protein
MMSITVKLIIAGWVTTFAMIGFFALKESGKLRKIRRRISSWREASASSAVNAPEQSLRSEEEYVA